MKANQQSENKTTKVPIAKLSTRIGYFENRHRVNLFDAKAGRRTLEY
jgi:hypothetical protein